MTVAQEKRWKAEAEIIKKLNKIPSSREMQRILKEDYGIVANHNTINADLKNDLEALTTEEYNNQKAGILKMIDDEINIAHSISQKSGDAELQLKAMNTVSKLSKTKSEILIKFKKAQAQLSKEDKPEINVYIGEPKKIDMEKFRKLEGEIKDEETEQSY
jgi:hypothetical protein